MVGSFGFYPTRMWNKFLSFFEYVQDQSTTLWAYGSPLNGNLSSVGIKQAVMLIAREVPRPGGTPKEEGDIKAGGVYRVPPSDWNQELTDRHTPNGGRTVKTEWSAFSDFSRSRPSYATDTPGSRNSISGLSGQRWLLQIDLWTWRNGTYHSSN